MKTTILLISLFFIMFTTLYCQNRDWEQITGIDRPVTEIKFSAIQNIYHFGLLFALPGDGGGLAYYVTPQSLATFSPASNLGATSIVSNDLDNVIYCGIGAGSYSDGLYEFDPISQEFNLISWEPYPNFVENLTSGYYFGCGNLEIPGCLLHSIDGEDWAEIEYFSDMIVTDVAENADGAIFITAGNSIYLEHNGNYTFIETPSLITDIYVRNYPNDNEVFIASGGGNENDGIFQVEYSNNEITGLIQICEIFQVNQIYEYNNYLVAGCSDFNSNLYLVEPEENGNMIMIGSEIEINAAYCFDFYPIYTENFMVGTDLGIFLATNLTDTDQTISNNEIYDLKNHPNPFDLSSNSTNDKTGVSNLYTVFSFTLPNTKPSDARIVIYNLKGQKVKTLPITLNRQNREDQRYSLNWYGKNEKGKFVTTGIYFYNLLVDKISIDVNKCVVIK